MLKNKYILYLFLLGIILTTNMSFRPTYAEEPKLQLTQKIKHETNERKTIVQLNAQGTMETVDVLLSDGIHVDVEQTLVKNIDGIESIKEFDHGFQVKFLNQTKRNEKIDLYIKANKNVKQGTIRAAQNKEVSSNELVVYLQDSSKVTKQVQPTGPFVKEEEQWEEVTEGRPKIIFGEAVIDYNTAYSRPIFYAKSESMFSSYLSGDLIINDKMLQVDNVPAFNSDSKVDMFNGRRKSKVKNYINSQKNKMLMVFTVDGKYDIQLLLAFTDTGDIDKTYMITNKSGSSVKIGLSEVVTQEKYALGYAYAFVPYSSDLINSRGNDSIGSTLIQWWQGDFENWTYGSETEAINFRGYTPAAVTGTGIEQLNAGLSDKGKWAFSVGNNVTRIGIAGKTRGRQVENEETIKISNKIHVSTTSPPVLTLNEKEFTVGHGNAVIELNGTAYDKISNGYRLMYYDETDKKSIVVKSYSQKAGTTVKIDRLTVDLGDLSVGDHKGRFYLTNDSDIGSEAVSVKIKVLSVGGKPVIQKVKVGDPFDKKIEDLFTEITGDQVTMTKLIKPDTSKIGFSKAVATLQDALGKKIDITIPVNVYDEHSTTFYDNDEIVVDGVKEAAITVGELELSGNWDDLIKEKVSLRAWDMRTGEKFTPKLKENNLQKIPGSYEAHFSIDKPEHPIIYDVTLQVTGFLKFEKVPDFDFGTVQIPGKVTMIPRAGKEQIVINDERGPNKTWRLTAMLTQESQSDKQKFGSLMFVHEDHQEEEMKPDKLILVETKETQKVPLQPVEWQEDTGVLFRTSPGSYLGKYSGTITWTLEDVPSNS